MSGGPSVNDPGGTGHDTRGGGSGGGKTYTVKNGDSWESIAGQFGNQRAFENFMRANPNILMLKAGQTIKVPKYNSNPYVSNATAASEGMATSGQVQQMYAQAQNGGYGAQKLKSPNPAYYASNMGYNLTTRNGQYNFKNQNNMAAQAGVPAGQTAQGYSQTVGTVGGTYAPKNTPPSSTPSSGIKPLPQTNSALPSAPINTGQSNAQAWRPQPISTVAQSPTQQPLTGVGGIQNMAPSYDKYGNRVIDVQGGTQGTQLTNRGIGSYQQGMMQTGTTQDNNPILRYGPGGTPTTVTSGMVTMNATLPYKQTGYNPTIQNPSTTTQNPLSVASQNIVQQSLQTGQSAAAAYNTPSPQLGGYTPSQVQIATNTSNQLNQFIQTGQNPPTTIDLNSLKITAMNSNIPGGLTQAQNAMMALGYKFDPASNTYKYGGQLSSGSGVAPITEIPAYQGPPKYYNETFSQGYYPGRYRYGHRGGGSAAKPTKQTTQQATWNIGQ